MKPFWPVIAMIFLVSCTQEQEKTVIENENSSLIPAGEKQSAKEPESTALTPEDHWYDNTNIVVEMMDTIAWSSIEEKDLFESTEGGVAQYFSSGDTMMLISTVHYGEMGQLRTNYYTAHGKLLFVREHKVEYSRPIYYTPDMTDEDDVQVTNDSIITEIKNYFRDGELIQQFRNQEKTVSEDRLRFESRRIHEEFDQLIEKRFAKT